MQVCCCISDYKFRVCKVCEGIAWSGDSSGPQQIDNKNQKVVWHGYETFNDDILQCQLMTHCQILINK